MVIPLPLNLRVFYTITNKGLAQYLILNRYSSSQNIPGDKFPGQVPDQHPGLSIYGLIIRDRPFTVSGKSFKIKTFKLPF